MRAVKSLYACTTVRGSTLGVTCDFVNYRLHSQLI